MADDIFSRIVQETMNQRGPSQSLYSGFQTTPNQTTPPPSLSADKASSLGDKAANKQAGLSNIGAQKQMRIGGVTADEAATAFAMGRKDLFENEDVLGDVQSMRPDELEQKYGPGAAAFQMDYLERAKQAQDVKRNQEVTAQEAAVVAGETATSLAGSIPVLGAAFLDAARNAAQRTQDEGMRWHDYINPLVGVGAAYNTMLKGADAALSAATGEDIDSKGQRMSPIVNAPFDAAKDFVGDFRSEENKAALAQMGKEAALLEAKRNREFDAEMKAAGDSLFDRALAQASNLGREARDYGTTLADYPTAQVGLAANAATSLYGIGATSKLIGKAMVKAELKAQGKNAAEITQALKSTEGSAAIRAATEKFVPLMSGALEGGSASMETIDRVMSMSQDEMDQNADYAKLRENGFEDDEARAVVASQAAGVAGGVSGLLAGGAGKLFGSKFEAAPTKIGAEGFKASAKEATKTVAKETAEEATQEASNQFGSNVGIATTGSDQRLLEGVGTSAAAGAAGGFGMAAGMQTPGVAGAAVKSGAVATAEAISKAAELRSTEAEVASTVDAPAQAKASHTVAESASAMLSALEPLSELAPVPENAQQEEGQAPDVPTEPVFDPAVLEDLKGAIGVHADEEAMYLNENPAQQEAKEKLGVVSRQAQLAWLADADAQHGDNPAVANAVAVTALRAVAALERATSDRVKEAIANAPDELKESLQAAHDAAESELQVIRSNPLIAKSQERLQSMDAETMKTSLSRENFSSDREYGEAMVVAGQYNIKALKESGLDVGRVLDQREEGDLSGELVDMMDTFDEIAVAQQVREEAYAEEGKGKTIENVHEDIMTMGFRDETGEASTKRKSLMAHRGDILADVQAGRLDDAKIGLEELANFAQHFANKIAAYNQSHAEGGKKVSFQAYDGTSFKENEAALFAEARSKESKRLASQARDEAVAIAAVTNTMGKRLAKKLKMDFTPVEIPDLAPEMDLAAGKQEAAQKALAERVAANRAKQEAKAPKKKAAPVEAPVEVKAVEPQAETAVEPVVETPVDEILAEAVAEQEQAVEEAPTAVKEEAPVKRKTVKELFTGMLNGKDGSPRAANMFKRRSTGRSALELDAPLDEVLRESSVGNAVVNVENADGNTRVDTEKSVRSMREAMGKYLNDALTEFALKQSTPKKGAKAGQTYSPIDLLGEVNEKGAETGPETWAGGQLLNFVDEQTGDINPKVLDAMTMAAVEWIVDADLRDRSAKMSNEEINKALGLPRNNPVTEAHRKLVEGRVGANIAVSAVADRLMEILNLAERTDIPVRQAQGLSRVLATNILAFMGKADSPWLTYHNDKDASKIPGSERSYFSYEINQDHPDFVALKAVLGADPNAFTAALNPESDMRTRFIGTPPKKIAADRMKRKGNPLSAVEQQVINKLQNTPNKVVRSMWAVADMFGDETLMQVFGHTPRAEDEGNRTMTQKIRSRNRMLEASFENARGYYDALPDEDTPIYFAWEISSVGRLFQRGPVTPQGNKVMRELVAATHSELDLSDEAHHQALWLAIAQSLDIGIEKMHPDQAQREAARLLNENRELVDAIKESLRTGEAQGDLVALAQAAENNSAAPIEMTPKALHAIVTFAEYEMHMSKEDPGIFETALALEFDGKTDGPINAMINMGIGQFTREDVDNFARGGLFLGSSEPVSLNRFIAGDENVEGGWSADSKDLYHKAAAAAEENIVELFKNLPQDQAKSLMTLFSGLSKNFSEDSGKPTVARNMIKNPLTVFLYGSGVDGIAGKMADEMLETLYKVFDDMAMDGTKWHQHKLFVENPALRDALKEVIPASALQRMFARPETAVLEDAEYKQFKKVVHDHLTVPMVEAIDEVTGGLQRTMQIMIAASNIQNVYYQAAFDQAVEARLKAKKEETGANATQGLLSLDEMNQIMLELGGISPTYTTETQEARLTGSERFDPKDARFAQSIDPVDPVNGAGQTVAVGDVSVKVAPNLVQGLGDAKMMINIARGNHDNVRKSLLVFDGVENNLENLTADGLHTNEAVLKGWLEESMPELVHESFAQFVQSIPNVKLNEEQKKQIDRSLKGLHELGVEPGIDGVKAELQEMALQNRARKNAIAKMAISSDHMAGAKAPAMREGETVPMPNGYAVEAVTEILQGLYEKELAALRGEKAVKDAAPTLEQETEGGVEALESVGKRNAKTGVLRIPARSIKYAVGAMRRLGGASAEQVRVFNDLVDDQLKGWSIYYGTPEQLAAQKAALGIEGTPAVQRGQTVAGAKAIFLTTANPETLIHEIVHGLIAEQTALYHSNPEAMSEEALAAYGRIEAMMGEFATMRFRGDTAQDRAGRELRDVMNNLPDDASKMDEFIAYMLTNKNLIDLGQATKVRHPLIRMALRVAQNIKRALGLKSYQGVDLFSMLKFNTEIIVKAPTVADEHAAATRVLEQRYGRDDQLRAVEQEYMEQLANYADLNAPFRGAKIQMVQDLLAQATTALNAAAKAGLSMNAREEAGFKAVHAAINTGVTLNAAPLRELARIQESVLEQINPKSSLGKFLNSARRQTGASTSDSFASFVALALTNAEFRDALKGMALPGVKEARQQKTGETGVDSFIKGWGRTIVNGLSASAIGKDLPKDQLARVDAMGKALVSIKNDRAAVAKAKEANAVQKLNEAMANSISSKAAKAADKLNQYAKAQDPKTTTGAAKGLAAYSVAQVAGMFDEATADANANSLLSMMNQVSGMKEARRLLVDIVGQTDETNAIVRLMNRARSSIDAVRQELREKVPDLLAEQFSKKLSKETWTNLQHGIAYTDLLALGRNEASDLLADPSKVGAAIQAVETELKQAAPKLYNTYVRQAKALAKYMTTKEMSANLQSNAYAIAMVNGSKEAVDAGHDQIIDRLVSLYAFDAQSAEVKKELSDLMQNEAQGMKTLLGFQNATRALEQSLLDTSKKGRMNGWKGYAASSTNRGEDIMIAPDADEGKLKMRGYVRVGSYDGDRADGLQGGKMSYYRSSTAGLATFRQGVAQTVHGTYMGVDENTGASREIKTGGLIKGAAAKKITRRIQQYGSRSGTGEFLRPIYDENGAPVAYERMLSAEMANALEADHHMGRMLGVWSGRIQEEMLANDTNQELVNLLKKHYDQGVKDGRKNEYINVADPNLKDEVIKEAYGVLGAKVKQAAAEAFGTDKMMVRKDMVEDAIGYRAASVRDLFNDKNNLPNSWNKAMRDAVTVFAGHKAYEWMVQAEDIVQDTVSVAKTTIIIRSLVVPIGNIVSNVGHLMMRGVPPQKVAKGMRDKFLEITEYTNNEDKIQRLRVEMAGMDESSPERLRALAKIKRINEMNERLSIWPFIEAGEFSTISESLTEADQEIRSGRLSDLIERAADKLPGYGKTAVQNLLITKDTELFHALNRSVQYGDFVAKAIYFEHMLEKGTDKEKALDVISEEYVNYNRLAGRGRDYLESIGMLWFWNYKLRIMKTVARTMRDNPFTALVGSFGAAAVDVDTVFSGSVVGAGYRGTLPYAVGPEMGINGLFMNPFFSAIR